MDYEKLHKDTINKLQQMVNSGKITAETARGICADFVPESEDERIRKEMITYLSTVEDKELIPYESWITWLEKQGEHANFRNKIQIGDKVTRNEDGVLVNLSQLKRVAKPAEEQGEQKQELLTKEKALKNSPFVEQKSAEWSEDDQSNFCELRSFIVETYRAEDASKLITWLESLKDRVQPQPKQEWSEEDEKSINTILAICSDFRNVYAHSEEAMKDADKIESWLKSLRPQNTWKPSDEQMAVLNEVINYAANSELQHWNSFIYTLLKSLREQLKKLREE